MKHAETILDHIGDYITVAKNLENARAELAAFKTNAEATIARFQQVADAIKGEPEEVAIKDPIEAILAVLARYKREAKPEVKD